MHRLLRRWIWHLGFGFDPAIDCCLWALERDGLPVPPFDRHGGGDGALRAAGLDAAGWWRWFARVVDATAERHRNLWDKSLYFKPTPRAAALWDGDPAISRRLWAMEEEYEEIWGEREARKIELVRLFEECSDAVWKTLSRSRRTLPPLRVIAVSYPGPLHCAMQPDTLVLAVGDWHPSSQALTAAILDGAHALAELRGSER
jgi:hypothetical protein